MLFIEKFLLRDHCQLILSLRLCLFVYTTHCSFPFAGLKNPYAYIRLITNPTGRETGSR